MANKFHTTNNHEFFFIKNDCLYEVFKTLKGGRVRHRLDLENVDDCEKLSLEQVRVIEEKFLK